MDNTDNEKKLAGAETAPARKAHEKNRYNKNHHGKRRNYDRSPKNQADGGENISAPVAEVSENGMYAAERPEERVNAAPENVSEPVAVVGIRFKPAGKMYYFDPCGITLKAGPDEYAIVETARGLEYGAVACSNKLVPESEVVKPLRPVVRKATEADKKRAEENKEKEREAFRIGLRKIEAHGLDMKLVDVEYTFDCSKLLFYFTSAGRVDFRELVKDLASVFHTRIELRQIGIRDETKLMGGIGACGRALCCAKFLSDFVQVSIKMAKEQGISLNSSKISGNCGRLMCCLRYEHESYQAELRATPPVGSSVRTDDGVGTITEINPVAGLVRVKLAEKNDAAPKFYPRESVKVLKMPKNSAIEEIGDDISEELDTER